jgi:hypothetical protein
MKVVGYPASPPANQAVDNLNGLQEKRKSSNLYMLGALASQNDG